jgi:hypothetical protein
MNTKEYDVKLIIFIKGVFINDCVPLDDVFETRIMEQFDSENTIITYNKFPTIFTNIGTWIKKININCWYCDLSFDDIPIFIPKIIENSGTTNEYKIITLGCFCSFCCAMSYNNLYFPKICDNINNKEMLKYLYKIFNNVKIKEILQAPNKYIMSQYGGDIDVFTYRNELNSIKLEMKELEYI